MKQVLFVFLLIIESFAQKIEVQILGSGGPELDGRASSSYLVWIDDKAEILIDAGSGAMLRYEQSGAALEDLQAIVLTHMHIDHTIDLASFVKAGYFTKRTKDLDIIGAYGNRYFPSASEYLKKLFGDGGLYPYMKDVLSKKSDSFTLQAVNIAQDKITERSYQNFRLFMTGVHHGSVPAIAVGIEIGSKRILISGDTNNKNNKLQNLIEYPDVLIAHHAIGSKSNKFARLLHMTPSIIGKTAQEIGAKKLVLSHIMKRSLHNQEQNIKDIRKFYSSEIVFAEDGAKVSIK